MKKTILHITAAMSLFLILGGVAAAQTTRQLTVAIPFAFHVGQTELPAGTYVVYRTSSNAGDGFLLRAVDGQAKAFFAASKVQSGESRAGGRLEFRQYGETSFLARVWIGGSNVGRELQPSALEREAMRLARKSAPIELVASPTR
jgi:hypothetical protein